MGNLILGRKTYTNIKNIIFDLGGVIVNVDFKATIDAFSSLGFKNFDKVYSQFQQNPLFDLNDKGLVTPDEFRIGLMQAAGINISYKEFDQAWNAMIKELPLKRIELLKKLKTQYNTFLLSNTNAIHMDFFFNRTQKETGIESFSSLFHKPYYSYNIGMRKPDEEIYQKVLNENNLIPSETLFIEDTLHNIKTAELLGINTYHISHSEDIAELFKD